MSILQQLHDSEINGSVRWLFDGDWEVTLGDYLSEPTEKASVSTYFEAEAWLISTAIRLFPGSAFAENVKGPTE